MRVARSVGRLGGFGHRSFFYAQPSLIRVPVHFLLRPINYNEHCSNCLTRAGKNSQKVVKLCENSEPAFEQVRRARFVRRRPSGKQTVAPNVALLLIRARYYDPLTGEFTSRDPLEYVDGMSLYRGYFGIGGVDPFGLNWVDTGTFDDQGRPVFQVNGGHCVVKVLDNNGKHVASQLVPCPPDRPIDRGRDVTTFNCAGLAFRDYEFKSKADTLTKLAGCKNGALGTPCPEDFSLKCIFYDITGIEIFKDGAVIQKSQIDDFHIVCNGGKW